MSLCVGKLGKQSRGKRSRAWVKNQTARKARRLARKLLDNAPVRTITGYAD